MSLYIWKWNKLYCGNCNLELKYCNCNKSDGGIIMKKEMKKDCKVCGNKIAWGYVKGIEESFRYPKTDKQWEKSTLMISKDGYEYDEIINVDLKEYDLCQDCKDFTRSEMNNMGYMTTRNILRRIKFKYESMSTIERLEERLKCLDNNFMNHIPEYQTEMNALKIAIKTLKGLEE